MTAQLLSILAIALFTWDSSRCISCTGVFGSPGAKRVRYALAHNAATPHRMTLQVHDSRDVLAMGAQSQDGQFG
jgi:hypothetical protein